MICYALLCGSAPARLIQKKLADTYASLTAGSGASDDKFCGNGRNVIAFPCGISELSLEAALNGALDYAADAALEEDTGDGGCEILLYFCARTEDDLNALSEYEATGYGRLPVIRLGGEEIRKDVIAYYEDLAEKLDVRLIVELEACGEFVREENLRLEMASSINMEANT